MTTILKRYKNKYDPKRNTEESTSKESVSVSYWSTKQPNIGVGVPQVGEGGRNREKGRYSD